MKPNFDETHKRIHTNSIKWDFAYQNGVLQKREVEIVNLAAGDLLPMWIADMDFQTAPPILEAIQQRVQHGIFGYSLPDESYYDAIISWMARRQNWQVERDWILTTSSVLFTLSVAVQTFTEPGDKVIVQTPVFKPFYQTIESNGRLLSRNPLVYENGRYHIDFDDLAEKAADPHAKMLILCSPHNPVGRVWSREELHQIGTICQQHDIMIVSDEIHSNLIYPWAEFTPFGAVDEAFHDRLILCNSPTKTFNTPGIRTATTFIPNTAIRSQFFTALHQLNESFGVSTIGTLVLQTAYNQGEEWLEELMVYLEANLHFLQTYIDQHLPQLHVVRPEAMFLVWVDCRALGLDATALQHLFYDKASVYLEEGSKYGPEGEGFMRFNIGCPRSTLEIALERIRLALSE